MECELCKQDIDTDYERHFYCPHCDSYFCEEEENEISVSGGLCPICYKAYVDEVDCNI